MLDISEEVKYIKEEWNKTETQKIAEMKQMFRKTVGSNKGNRNHELQSSKLKERSLSKRRGSNLPIQELINRARSNNTFNNTISTTFKPPIATPKPVKLKTKIILKRYKSNFSLGGTPNQLSSVLQQQTSSNS